MSPIFSSQSFIINCNSDAIWPQGTDDDGLTFIDKKYFSELDKRIPSRCAIYVGPDIYFLYMYKILTQEPGFVIGEKQNVDMVGSPAVKS